MSIGVYIKPARGRKKGGPWLRIEGFELLEQKIWYPGVILMREKSINKC